MSTASVAMTDAKVEDANKPLFAFRKIHAKKPTKTKLASREQHREQHLKVLDQAFEKQRAALADTDAVYKSGDSMHSVAAGADTHMQDPKVIRDADAKTRKDLPALMSEKLVYQWHPLPDWDSKTEYGKRTGPTELLAFMERANMKPNSKHGVSIHDMYADSRRWERQLLDHKTTITELINVREEDKAAARTLVATTEVHAFAIHNGSIEAAVHRSDGKLEFNAIQGIAFPNSDVFVAVYAESLTNASTNYMTELILSDCTGALTWFTLEGIQPVKAVRKIVLVEGCTGNEWLKKLPKQANCIFVNRRHIVALFNQQDVLVKDYRTDYSSPNALSHSLLKNAHGSASSGLLKEILDQTTVCCASGSSVILGTAGGEIWLVGKTGAVTRMWPGGDMANPIDPAELKQGRPAVVSPEKPKSQSVDKQSAVMLLRASGFKLLAATKTRVRVWDMLTYEPEPYVFDLELPGIVGAAFQGNLLALHSNMNMIRVIDLQTKSKGELPQIYADTFYPCNAYQFDNMSINLNVDRAFIACVGTGGVVTYARVATENELKYRERTRETMREQDQKVEEALLNQIKNMKLLDEETVAANEVIVKQLTDEEKREQKKMASQDVPMKLETKSAAPAFEITNRPRVIGKEGETFTGAFADSATGNLPMELADENKWPASIADGHNNEETSSFPNAYLAKDGELVGALVGLPPNESVKILGSASSASVKMDEDEH